MTKHLKEVADCWTEEVWQGRDIDAVDRLHAPDFVDRSNPAGRAPDNAGFKQGLRDLFAAFPDWYASSDDLVADEAAGKVAVRWSASGTHMGPFMGRAATRRRVTFQGIEILRIVDGRIAERWGEWDGLAILAQLDA